MTVEFQKRIIRGLKKIEEGYSLADIPVIDESKAVVGYLKPIDKKLIRDKTVISCLTRWRQMAMPYFFTQFKATDERTKKWLNSNVINDDQRVLFIITDARNNLIGNIGICSISAKSVELDNLIRGENGGYPNLIFFSEVSLLNWAFETLKVDEIYLHVFSKNLIAIRLHGLSGFARGPVYPVIKKEKQQEISYRLDSSRILANTGEIGIMKMNIIKDDFFANHPWLKER